MFYGNALASAKHPGSGENSVGYFRPSAFPGGCIDCFHVFSAMQILTSFNFKPS
jgi:hypothetical protein